MKKCPYCAEEIQDEAIACRYCGRELTKPATPSQPAKQQIQKPTAKKRATILSIVGLFSLFCCGLLMVRAAATNNPRVSITSTPKTFAEGTNSSVVISSFTPKPTNTPAPTHTPLPTFTQEPEIVALIPGLMPVDVILNLEQRGFTCTSAKKIVYYERSCQREEAGIYLFNVDIGGRDPFIVDFIDTTVLQFTTPSNEIAAALMGFVATMPYDNATPEEARAWVENTIPTLSGEPGGGKEMVFAGVKYLLFGPPTALTLQMGDIPELP